MRGYEWRIMRDVQEAVKVPSWNWRASIKGKNGEFWLEQPDKNRPWLGFDQCTFQIKNPLPLNNSKKTGLPAQTSVFISADLTEQYV